MVQTVYLILLVPVILIGTSSCKTKEIKRPIRSSNSLGFYLSPLEQLDRLISLDPEAPDSQLLNGIENDRLNPFIKPEHIAKNKAEQVPSLFKATDYLSSNSRGGLNKFKIEKVQERLWIELNPLAVLKQKAIELVSEKGIIPEDNYGHYVVTRLSKEQNHENPKNIKILFKKLGSVSSLDQFEKLLKAQYTIPNSYLEDFKSRFNIGDFDPSDILQNHGFRVDDPSPEYKPIKRTLRDELLRYSKELNYEQKLALYQTIQDQIKTDDSLAFLKGQIFRKEAARKIPFSVLMEAMVENRSVFGPYIIKKIQQEYSRINSMKIALKEDVQGFLKKSQARNLSPSESEMFLERARKLIPQILGEGSRVLQAGSLGIVFENHENKIVKWVPDEVIASLLDDKGKYLAVIQNIDAGQGISYPRDVLDAGMGDEYRRRLRDEWQIKVDEIDEFLAETDLAAEVENGEKVSSYNTIFRQNNKKVGEITVISGNTIDAAVVSSELVPDLEKREKIASRFNIQEKSLGYDLKWFNDPKNHSRISSNQRIQIQNSLQKLMDIHFQGMFSGNYFHGDLHEGNIRIELHEEGSKTDVKKIGMIDLGTIGYLDLIERQSLKGIFDLEIAKKILEDPDIIEKILYYNYNSLPDEQRQVLVKRDGFNFSIPQNYQEAEIGKLDSRIKYYMTGLSKQGFNLSVDGFKLGEFKTFLEIFAGKPVPNDEALRLLGLRSNVVALFKATSTGVGVVHASNLRAGNYISTADRPQQVAQKSVADFFNYLGKINAYSLEPESAELLVEQSQMDRSRSGISGDMLDYMTQRRKRGVSLEANAEAIWRDVFLVESERLMMQDQLEKLVAERQVLSEQLEDLNRSNLEEKNSKTANVDLLDELQKQLLRKDEIYKDSLSTLENQHARDIQELQKKISALETGKLASEQEINQLNKYLKDLQEKQIANQKLQNEYTDLQDTSRGLETKLRNLTELSSGEKEGLEQVNRQLQSSNEELKAKQNQLTAIHDKAMDDLNSKLETDLASRDNKIRSLQETQRNLGKEIQKSKVVIRNSNSVQESQLRRLVKLNEELDRVHIQLRKAIILELENNRLREDLQELTEFRENIRFLFAQLKKAQSESSNFVKSIEIEFKDVESSRMLKEIQLLLTKINGLNQRLSQSPTQEEKNQLEQNLETKELAISDLQTALENRPKSSEVVALNQELSRNQNKLEALRDQIEQMSKVQGHLDDERQISTQIRTDLKTKEQELGQVKDDIALRQKSLDQLSREFDKRDLQHEKEIESFRKQLESARKRSAQFEQSEEDNRKLQQRIASGEAESILLSKKIQSLETDFQISEKKAKSEINRLKEQIQNKADAEGQLKQKVSDLEEKMQVSAREFSSKEKALQVEKLEIERDLKDLNDKLSQANKDSIGKQRQIQKLQAELNKSLATLRKYNDIEGKLQDANTRINLLKKEDSNIRAKVTRLEQERATFRQHNIDLTEQLGAAKSDIASMKKSQMNNSRWEELQTRLEESQARNKKIANELNEAQVRNKSLLTDLETARSEAKKIGEAPTVVPQRMNPILARSQYKRPVININRHTTHINKAAFKGLGALYFGVGASLISGGSILINEGIKNSNQGR
ncbi:MAG: hypothetical protein AB8G05_07935 [Oligoflexales bacterium]